jgi:hypothetical protein
MRMLNIVAGHKRARCLDLMDQSMSEQKFERAVNGWRPEFTPLALELCKQSIGAGRLV